MERYYLSLTFIALVFPIGAFLWQRRMHVETTGGIDRVVDNLCEHASGISRVLVVAVCVFSVSACKSTPLSVASGQDKPSSVQDNPADAPVKLSPVTEDMASRVTRRISLSGIPIISEADFVRLLTNGRADHAHDSKRAEAAELVALSNSKSALGVEGEIKYGAHVEGEVFLVARDPALTKRGTIQSKSFYISAVRLSGGASWTVPNSSLLLTNTLQQAPDKGLQGCAPLTRAAAGLPINITLNLESGLRPTNASSQLIELHVFGDTNGAIENRFVCAGSVHVDDAHLSRPRRVPSLSQVKSTLQLPKDSIVISEANFYRILNKREKIPVSEKTKSVAARVIAAASEPSALGIQARFGKGRMVSSSLVVVARNPVVRGSTLRATQFYLAPIDFVGTTEWLGENVSLGFSGEIPTFNFNVAPCGSLVLPGREPNCQSGMCIGAPHPWMGLRGGFAPGNPSTNRDRPTIRLFEKINGRWNINAIACTQFLYPPEREVTQCGRTDAGGISAEICNGRDDDCNGWVDDGGVCENLPTSCPAQPRTCGAITCGDIPDGAGGVLPCGGPCQ